MKLKWTGPFSHPEMLFEHFKLSDMYTLVDSYSGLQSHIFNRRYLTLRSGNKTKYCLKSMLIHTDKSASGKKEHLLAT